MGNGPSQPSSGQLPDHGATLLALEQQQLAQALALSAAEAAASQRGVAEQDTGNDAALARALADEEERGAYGGEKRVQPRAGLCAGCSQPLRQSWSTATISASDGASWHASCFVCSVCGERIVSSRFAMTPDGRPCHSVCHTAVHRPRCDVCDAIIPAGPDGTIQYGSHQFWGTKSCREHGACYPRPRCSRPLPALQLSVS